MFDLERFAHVAYGGENLFLAPKPEAKEPNYCILFFADQALGSDQSRPLPDKGITISLAMLNNGRFVKIVRNANYMGEYKEGVFAALITRGPVIPSIPKSTREQAVADMMLGQAMRSSAGDPTQAGRIRSEFFYDPFVAGDLAEHANIFYEITKGVPQMNYYLLNTGRTGEAERYRDKIGIYCMV